MKFAIGIITYYPDVEVLDRIERYRLVTDNILIFDNTPQKNEVSLELEGKYSGYINYKKNLGLSIAINYFFNYCKKNKIDILLTMDQDSIFKNKQIEKMLTIIETEDDKSYSMYCPNYRKIYFNNRNEEVTTEFKIDIDKNKDVLFSMTSGSFYKIKDFDNIIPLENLFIGYVDYEISFRVIQIGKKIKMIGSIYFDQQVGERIKDNWFNQTFHVIHHEPQRYRYMSRNNYFLQAEFKKNRDLKMKLKKDLIRLVFNILIGEKNKIEKLRNMNLGFLDFKKNKLGQLKE